MKLEVNAWNGECAGLPKQGANSSAYGRRTVNDRFLQEKNSHV